MASFSKKFSVPGKSSDHIYSAISSGIEQFLSKTPLGNVDVQRDDQSKKVSFKASMASGSLTALDGEVQVDISLSLLASAFKGKIDDGITKWISKTFGA